MSTLLIREPALTRRELVLITDEGSCVTQLTKCLSLPFTLLYTSIDMAADPLSHIKSLVQAEEIIEPSSSSYRSESITWAAQKNLHPRLVVRPKTLESLSSILAYLSKTPLDFAVRSQGFGSSSAKDVLISMTAFDGFEFDRKNEVVTVGAGQTWEDYYKKMEGLAPDYSGIFTLLNRCESKC